MSFRTFCLISHKNHCQKLKVSLKMQIILEIKFAIHLLFQWHFHRDGCEFHSRIFRFSQLILITPNDYNVSIWRRIYNFIIEPLFTLVVAVVGGRYMFYFYL